MKKEIHIILNGCRQKVCEGDSVSALIRQFEEKDKSLIVELNHKFVYQLDYPHVFVSDGDEVEFINPNFGG